MILFQGIWSERSKGLQLSKGKKGSYPNAMRQVPAQPIKFGKSLYNTRKLNELPFHLIHSGQFDHILTYLFCDPDWLYSKCLTMTLTSVMEDFRLAEELCVSSMTQKPQQVAKVDRFTKMREGNEATSQEVKVLEGIRLVKRMVLLAADSIRKDAVNLPLIVSISYCSPYVYIDLLCRNMKMSVLVC